MGGPSQDELREQVERFAPVLDISPSALVVTDPDTIVVAWNQAAQTLFGTRRTKHSGATSTISWPRPRNCTRRRWPSANAR